MLDIRRIVRLSHQPARSEEPYDLPHRRGHYRRHPRRHALGEVTSAALVEAYRERIDALDRGGPRLNSVLATNEQAAERAAELDAEVERTGELSGPLHGIPVLVKDCIETSGIPTTFGSEAITGYTPAQDAVTVRKLRERRRGDPGQDNAPGLRHVVVLLLVREREAEEPLRPQSRPGRLSAGTGAAIAASLATVGDRDRLRRLDPSAVLFLRAGGGPRHSGCRAAHGFFVSRDLPGHDRADDAHGRRRRHRLRRPRRL